MATSTVTRTENSENIDTRLGMLDTLLTTPHRDLAKVATVHQQLIKQDPLFYVRLGAWYNDTGEVRDHKEMFVISLCLSDFDGHRDVGRAMLREMPPYQVARVVDFIHGVHKKVPTKVTTGVGKAKKVTTTVKVEKVGLFRNVPRSVTAEVAFYLREREVEADWFDATVLSARKSLKRLYTLLHIKPAERAQKILFDEEAPDDSRLASIKALRKAETPAAQAQIIMENKIPYRLASTVVTSMTPTILLALISVMTDQELINNVGSLKKRGAFDNAELKQVINTRLDKAKTGKRVAAMKTSVAKAASGVDEETQKKLDAIGDAQVKSKGKISRPTALLLDKSASMNTAIEIGKRMGSMLSAIMDAPLYVYAFDTMAYPIKAEGTEMSQWEKAFKGINSGGGTSCGIGVQTLLRNKQRVDQIIVVTDEDEQSSPPFVPALQNYIKTMAVTPNVLFVKCGSAMNKLEVQCKAAGIEFDAYKFDGDYFSLPGLIQYLTKPSKNDLLMDVMSWPLPVRKTA
jgi:hypothetical protein